MELKLLCLKVIVITIKMKRCKSQTSGNVRCKKSSIFDGWCYYHATKHIQIGKKLGQGFNGSVFECTIDGVLYSLKLFSNNRPESIEREKISLLELKHVNIIKMHREIRYKDKKGHILEYAPKDLFSCMEEGLPIVKARHYVKQLLTGISYIHSQGYIYRDIKPENCLVTREDELKICDFDTSIKAKTYVANRLVGTTEYLAPEIINGLRCTNKVDIWAIGVLVYELYHGVVPFEDTMVGGVMDNIIQMNYTIPLSWSYKLKSFIKDCLQWNPKRRPTAANLLLHPFLL
jgi:serine/threonine protein kinase